MLLQRIFLLLITIFFTSCSYNSVPPELEDVLQKAGENKDELLKVLTHYQKPKDSLKLRAAIYLIKNLDKHAFFPVNSTYQSAFNLAGEKRKALKEKEPEIQIQALSEYASSVLSTALDSIYDINKSRPTANRILDISHVDSNYLINNIELAFKAYERNPLSQSTSFDDFLQYVLPYRASAEPLEFSKRNELYQRYHWVYDSLQKYPMEKVVKMLYNNIDAKAIPRKNRKYSQLYSVSETETAHLGNCSDVCNYFVNVFRAVGIPTGIHYLNKWGDDYTHGRHSWIFYKIGDSIVPLNAGYYQNVKKIYKVSSIPVIKEESFDLNYNEHKTVTDFYRDTFDADIEILWNQDKVNDDGVSLGIYDQRDEVFDILNVQPIRKNQVRFENLGNNIIYFPYVRNGGRIHPVNYPFELDKKGHISYFQPSDDKLKEVTVVRKFPPFTLRRTKVKQRRIHGVNTLILQGSHSLKEEDFKTIHKFSGFNSTHKLKFSLKRTPLYRYYRLKDMEGLATHLAEFNFYDADKKIQNWDSIYMEGLKDVSLSNLNDNNSLTHEKIRKENDLIFYAKRGRSIDGFEIQVRNDDNHINPGETYELFLWNKNWQSMGQQIAEDTLLVYKNIPKNGLYLLKNHTKGREEFVFKFDNLGKQFWVGVTDYENDDSVLEY